MGYSMGQDVAAGRRTVGGTEGEKRAGEEIKDRI